MTGDVVAIDQEGIRKSLDDDANVRWFWYSVLGEFPAPPRIPTDPEAQQRARDALAQIEADRARDFKVTVNAEGRIVITTEDGVQGVLPSA